MKLHERGAAKHMARKLIKRVALAAIAVALLGVFVASASASSDYPPSDVVIHKTMGKHDFYIPVRYTYHLNYRIDLKDGAINTYYPGAAPIPKGEDGPFDKAQQDKQIFTEIDDLDPIPASYRTGLLDRIMDDRIKNSQAFHVVGEQYGLIHQDQADNPNKVHVVHNEFWIERKNGTLVSFIECDGESPMHECTLHFSDKNYIYKILFDKVHLPDWSTIRTNVVALIDSFQSEASARAFFNDQMSKTKHGQGG